MSTITRKEKLNILIKNDGYCPIKWDCNDCPVNLCTAESAYSNAVELMLEEFGKKELFKCLM